MTPPAGVHVTTGEGGCRKQHSGFTLIELLAVIAVILILVAVAVPGISSSVPRRVAILELQGALEAARSQALRNQTEVYVAFMDESATEIQQRFRRYAVFARERDAARRYFSNQVAPDTPGSAFPTSELTALKLWSDLPEGILLGFGRDVTGLPYTVIESGTKRLFPVPTPGGGADDMLLPFLMFNAQGRLVFPEFWQPDYHYLVVLEGFYDEDGTRVITAWMADPGGGDAQVPVFEALGCNVYSGRIRLMSASQ